MIERGAVRRLVSLAGHYPVVTVTGPRQSGKTTLCRGSFPGRPYVTLEPLDVRQSAEQDPRGFLAQFPAGAIIDEVQRVPNLLSFLQPQVDADPTPGRFILTGSQHLALTAAVSQSLAGRTGILELYPPSWGELKRFPTAPTELLEVLWKGAYPRIYDRGIPADQWLADYVATYVQRDVRQMLKVGDLRTFTNFVALCAGSTAAEINLTRLGSDSGVTHNTAKAWLSVLEASYLIFRVPGLSRNVRKQIVKSAKLHFVDTGLVCHLLGIRAPEQLWTHPLRGAVFETWVVAEVMKQLAHLGDPSKLFHYRDAGGLEVDLLVDTGSRLVLAEAKSGATFASDFVDAVERLASALRLERKDRSVVSRVVYGGTMTHGRPATEVVPWNTIDSVAWGGSPGVGVDSARNHPVT